MRYVDIKSPTDCIIHSDLTDDHLLLSPTGNIGIIDFSDAVIWDPAVDFAFLWSYGDWVPQYVFDQCSHIKDAGILSRSYWHYVRYRIDCFYSDLMDDRLDETDIARGITAWLGAAVKSLTEM